MNAAQVVAAARSDIGYTESPPNSNRTKFAAEAGHANGHFWCATFTTAILKRCAVPIPPGAGTASTRANLAAWKKAGRWVQPGDVRPGDVLLYHLTNRNGAGQPDHTGICVEAPSGGRVVAIEGNTSSDDHGSQDNGGGVYMRTRGLGAVMGAGRPAYAVAPLPPQPEPEEDDMFILNPVTDAPDTTQYFANGPKRVALTADEAQQFRNSGFQQRDMEPLAFAIFKLTNTEVPRP